MPEDTTTVLFDVGHEIAAEEADAELPVVVEDTVLVEEDQDNEEEDPEDTEELPAVQFGSW